MPGFLLGTHSLTAKGHIGTYSTPTKHPQRKHSLTIKTTVCTATKLSYNFPFLRFGITSNLELMRVLLNELMHWRLLLYLAQHTFRRIIRPKCSRKGKKIVCLCYNTLITSLLSIWIYGIYDPPLIPNYSTISNARKHANTGIDLKSHTPSLDH